VKGWEKYQHLVFASEALASKVKSAMVRREFTKNNKAQTHNHAALGLGLGQR
jgi:hypothetical protein